MNEKNAEGIVYTLLNLAKNDLPTISNIILKIISKVLGSPMGDGHFLKVVDGKDFNMLKSDSFHNHTVAVGKNNLANFTAISHLLFDEGFVPSLFYKDSGTRTTLKNVDIAKALFDYLESYGTCYDVTALREDLNSFKLYPSINILNIVNYDGILVGSVCLSGLKQPQTLVGENSCAYHRSTRESYAQISSCLHID